MEALPAWGVTLLRIMVGAIYLAHGYQAYDMVGPAGTTAEIATLGFSEELARALAWYLIGAHVAGGLLLLMGLWTRIAALVQVPIVGVAFLFRDFDQGFFLHGVIAQANTGRTVVVGYEYVLLVLVATLALVLLGPGRLSFETTRAAARERARPVRRPSIR